MKPPCKPMRIRIGSLLFIQYALSNVACTALPLFPPRQRTALHQAILDEILEKRVVSSRNRLNPRGVKRKMSNYPLRPRQRSRTRRIEFAKRIRIIK